MQRDWGTFWGINEPSLGGAPVKSLSEVAIRAAKRRDRQSQPRLAWGAEPADLGCNTWAFRSMERTEIWSGCESTLDQTVEIEDRLWRRKV